MSVLAEGLRTEQVGAAEATYRVRVTEHPVVVDGATVGHVVATGYEVLVDGAPDAARPVVFLFNGGPVVASMWLHLGGLGPRQVPVPTDLGSVAPALVPQPDSLLDVADLVYLDPIGTGYARLAEGADPASVRGVDADARAVAGAVSDWLEGGRRLGSPVHLVGESYGTVRAPLVAQVLLEQPLSIACAGIVLLGQAVTIQETAERPRNVVGQVAALPFMAAAAWFHGRRGAEAPGGPAVGLPDVVGEAVAWAHEQYLPALHAGTRLSPDERERVVAGLAARTGIAAEQWRRRRLRLSKEEFRTLLLADRGLVLGRYDARYVSPVSEGPFDVDASTDLVSPAFVAAVLRWYAELGVPADRRFRPADEGAFGAWSWLPGSAAHRLEASGTPSPFNVFDYAGVLEHLMAQRPDLRLFVGTGYFDSLTTVGAVEHLLAQADLPAERVVRREYPAGHMMYTDPACRAALVADLRVFLACHGDETRTA
ncbi:S10 family serine carboxypeptidase-like protein [Cellulomonas soli]|uniref:S10 family serine carboxypeptidase-like protein n=1 Tax=Cellulomonas soli TaxID=931535 RepID=UPI003F833A21